MKVVNAATQPLLRAIGQVVGSDVLADAVAFFQSFAGMEGGFRQRAEEVIELLRSDDTVLRDRRLAAPRHRDRGGVVRRADRRARHQPRRPASPTGCTRRSAPGTAADALARADAAPRATSPRCGATSPTLRALAEAARGELAPFAELLGDGPLATVPLLAGDVHDLAGLDEIRRSPVRRTVTPGRSVRYRPGP